MTNTPQPTADQQQFIDATIARGIALASTPIEQEAARSIIRDLYAISDLEDEKCVPIFYARSPIEAVILVNDIDTGVIKLPKRKKGENDVDYCSRLDAFAAATKPSMGWRDIYDLPADERRNILDNIHSCTESEYRLAWAAALRVAEFMNVELDQEDYKRYVRSAEDIGWIMSYDEACIIIDRPQHRFDDEKEYHGDGVPSILYPDGFAIYHWHGTLMPVEYGRLPSEMWKPEWLLKESNSEIRKILIEQIGYDRIVSALDGKVIDTWVQPKANVNDEYENRYDLIRFEGIDIEPVVLLKMTCPSTNHIHSVRVAPSFTSAREAIRRVNRGIDPTEFAVQA